MKNEYKFFFIKILFDVFHADRTTRNLRKSGKSKKKKKEWRKDGVCMCVWKALERERQRQRECVCVLMSTCLCVNIFICILVCAIIRRLVGVL